MPENQPNRRILLAHKDAGDRKVLQGILEGQLGHSVSLSTGRGQELLTAFKADPPDLVISSVYLEDGDAIQYLIEACRTEPRPSIIVTERSDLKHVERALEDHVMSYLVEPVSADDLRPSIHLVVRRFAEFQELRDEVEDLNEALRIRKVVEKAKGWLMAEKEIDERAAHKRLQEMASKKRKRLVEVAESILLAAEL